MSLKFFFIHLFFVFLLIPKIALSNEAKWLVNAENLKCVITNIEEYRSTKSDPLMIILPACPITDQTEALSAIAQNSLLEPPNSDDEGVKPTQKIDSILILNLDELDCLQDYVTDNNSEFISIPKVGACQK